MIDVQELHRRFGPTRALEGVSFRVEAGEITGLLGPNGAGKSTILRTLVGYLPPSQGSCSVAGFDTAREPLEVRRRVGYLPELNPLPPEMRVSEYLHYRARLKGLGCRLRRERVAHVIERCDLQPMRRRVIAALSRGYRQRVGIADALLTDPAVLLLDEPTAGLDPLQRREILNWIASWRGEKTVLISSHILPDIEATCDRVVMIHGGRVVVEGSLEELTSDVDAGAASLEDLFGRFVLRGETATITCRTGERAPRDHVAGRPSTVARRIPFANVGAMRAVASREFWSVFRTPLGFVLLAAFYALLGFHFHAQVIDTPDELRRGLVRTALPAALGFEGQWTWLWFCLLPPLLTMRSFAEERRSGTLEPLLTAPVRSSSIVLGKFVATLALFVLAWIPGVVFLVSVNAQGTPVDVGWVLSHACGVLSLGAFGIALGLYCSSLFGSQVLAAALSVFASLLFALPNVLPELVDSTTWRTELERLSLFHLWDQSFRRGLVDTAHLALFSCLTLLFLAWTTVRLEVLRWR